MRITTVKELILQLSKFPSDSMVMIAYQPRYPLAAYIAAVAQSKQEEEEPSVVWLAASGHVSNEESPYAPRDVWE